jgi:hypothetical protein
MRLKARFGFKGKLTLLQRVALGEGLGGSHGGSREGDEDGLGEHCCFGMRIQKRGLNLSRVV